MRNMIGGGGNMYDEKRGKYVWWEEGEICMMRRGTNIMVRGES